MIFGGTEDPAGMCSSGQFQFASSKVAVQHPKTGVHCPQAIFLALERVCMYFCVYETIAGLCISATHEGSKVHSQPGHKADELVAGKKVVHYA